jgi:hypothetical protein
MNQDVQGLDARLSAMSEGVAGDLAGPERAAVWLLGGADRGVWRVGGAWEHTHTSVVSNCGTRL